MKFSSILVSIAAVVVSCQSAFSATFTVINTDDGGAGSLRDAIGLANALAGLDAIAFNIPGAGVHTITPTTRLPSITDPITIDGYTQPGASPNTLANGDDAVLLIEISGATVSASGNGLELGAGSDGSTVRGLVIDSGWSSGILILSKSVVVTGCFLGTDPTGSLARGNTNGIRFEPGVDTSSGQVGGSTPAERNVISGNPVGVFLGSGTNQVVLGNFIGVDATGANGIPNGTGVDIETNTDFGVVIGGYNAGERNVIVGSTNSILIGTGFANRVLGNFIGTDVSGAKGLGTNGNAGIFITGDSLNALIGAFTSKPGTGAGNVISGNAGSGIVIDSTAGHNVIEGNLVGTDATGTQRLGNGQDGMSVHSAYNIIGGSQAEACNVISANGLNGIQIGSDSTLVRSNLVQHNVIGADITGTQLLGNGGDGILATDSTDNIIGGEAANAGNVIAGNGANGVGVGSGVTRLTINGNSIFGNGGLGIDLGLDFVTLNDDGDGDTGPNNLQNFPKITTVTATGGNVTISGSLNSTPDVTYKLEFFANAMTDASLFGEGQTFLGSSFGVRTDETGNATFSATFPLPVPIGPITATATDADSTFGDTSEFSPAFGTELLNISTRLNVLTGDNVLISGFIITGFDSKTVIVRGIGPSLGLSGLSGVLEDPVLELHEADGTLLNNDNWRDTQEDEIMATGIPPGDDLESAIVATLPPGQYTAILSGKNDGTGVGLVEVYDLDQSAGATLGNISARGFVETGEDIMIGGFIVGPADTGPADVLVRGIGPSLSASGIANPLLDPILELHDANGALLTSNDNWKDTQQTEIEATGIPPSDDNESAIFQSLAPGAYTAILRGVGNTTGVGLVEVYNLQ